MEIETIKPNLEKISNKYLSDSRLLGLDLPLLIETMKHSFTWAKGELNSLILLKSPGKNILLTAIHKGTEIISFQTNDSATFQIVEGRLRIHLKKDNVTLSQGQLLTLDVNIKYKLIAEEETVFLLTVAGINVTSANN
jgi:quercetin dioxygenase-like cupin family protein